MIFVMVVIMNVVHFLSISASAWFSNDFCDGWHPYLIPQRIMNVLIFFLCVSFCVRFPGNRFGCMSGSEKFETGLWCSWNKKHVMLTSCFTCVTLFSRHLGCRFIQPFCYLQRGQCTWRRAASSGRLYQQQVACPARRRGAFQKEKCNVTWVQIYMSIVSHTNLCLMLDIFSSIVCWFMLRAFVLAMKEKWKIRTELWEWELY